MLNSRSCPFQHTPDLRNEVSDEDVLFVTGSGESDDHMQVEGEEVRAENADDDGANAMEVGGGEDEDGEDDEEDEDYEETEDSSDTDFELSSSDFSA